MAQHSAKSGIAWSAIERFSVQGVQFFLSILLARFLLPSDYGLIAMLGIFIAVSQQFINGGFSMALIQKQNKSEKDYSTVFYFNMVMAFLLYFVLFFTAPIISEFYDEPKLIEITRFAAFSLIISSVSLIQETKLRIDLDFKTLSKASFSSAFISGVIGVLFAAYGYGVWALVIQSLLGALIRTMILLIVTRWRPLFSFSIESFRNLFGFGSRLLLSNLLHTIYLNLYTLVIGKFYSPYNVGLYNRAVSLSQYPSTNIVSMVSNVFYPKLCEAQESEKECRHVLVRYLRLTMYIVTPLCFGLAAMAEPFVYVVLTDKWTDLIIPLKILSWAYVLYPLMSMNNQPILARSRSDLFLVSEIIKKVVAIIVMIIAIPYGLSMLCLSVLVYNIVDFLITIPFTKKVIKTGYVHQFKEFAPVLCAGVIMEIIIELFLYYSTFSAHFNFIIGMLIGVVSFIMMCIILKIPELKDCLSIVRKYNI